MIEITRGVEAPDQYVMRMSEEMLMFMEQGTLSVIKGLEASIKAHARCNLYDDDGCLNSQAAVIKQYGSLEAARDQSIYPVDCSEDLAYLHHALSQQMQMLFQSRYLRSVRDAPKALPSRSMVNTVAIATIKDNTQSLLGLQSPVAQDSSAVFDDEAGTWKPVDSSITDTGVIPVVEERTGPKHKLEKGK